MISGIGCDIVEHSLTVKLGWIDDEDMLRRIFSKNEILLSPKFEAVKYYSSRYAIKEAILKCLNTGMEDKISLSDIDIHKTKKGSLQVTLNGGVKKIAELKSITNWHISVSHSKDSSIAFVIAENQNINKIF